jgi:hypothetical protein
MLINIGNLSWIIFFKYKNKIEKKREQIQILIEQW